LYVETLKENGEHYLLADRVDTEGWWTLKAAGILNGNGVFLIRRVPVRKWKISHFIWKESGHSPNSVANAFVDLWKQTLVIRGVPGFEVGITQFMV